MKFTSKKPEYEYLRKKWIARHSSTQNKFWEKHGESLKHLAVSSLSSLMLLNPSSPPQLPLDNTTISRDDAILGYDKNVLLAQVLSDKVPKEVRPLELSEEKGITDILSRNFGFKVTSELGGIRLDRNYGLIGGEQHLYRYPGDNIYQHGDTSLDWAKYGSAGIAPSLGAWGYFASSKQAFSAIDKLREKYYLAIQTFKVSGYAENVDKYRDFFKFRKMLVLNPKTGQAVVADIADVGPSEWTGKHLGGSPEVMDILGLADGPRKGAVLYFFIDDPKDEVPLGPIKVRSEG